MKGNDNLLELLSQHFTSYDWSSKIRSTVRIDDLPTSLYNYQLFKNSFINNSMSNQQLLAREDSQSTILAAITPILSNFNAFTTGSILSAIGVTSALLLIILIARKVMGSYKNRLIDTTNDVGTHPEQFQQLQKAAPASSERNVITVQIHEAPTPRYLPEPAKQIRSLETIEDSDQDTNHELSGVFRQKLSSRGGSKKVKSKILKGIAKGPTGSDNSDEQQCVEV